MKKSIIIQSLSGLILLLFAFQGFAQWEDTGLTPMPTPRFGASATALDGNIYVIGGIDFDGTPTLRTVEIYDPTENTWSTGTDIPIPLYRPGCVVYSGKIYIFGGVDPEGKSDKVFEFDPENPDSWVEKATMPTPINWHQAQVVQDSIYIFGGINDTWVDSTLVYLPKTDDWVIREAMPEPRGLYAAEAFEDTIYVMGGIHFGLTHNQVYAYTPQSNTWIQKGNMPDSKMSAESVTYGEDIYLFGGWWAFNPFNLPGEFSAQTWKFHPPTDTWENLDADLPDDEVVGHASAVGEDPDGNICIFAFGGAYPEFWDGPPGNVTGRVLKLNLTAVSVKDVGKTNTELVVMPNYPDPFNATTNISYELMAASRVQILVMDISGQIVEHLLNEFQMPGKYTLEWNAQRFAPGIYSVKIQTEFGSVVTKCVLQK